MRLFQAALIVLNLVPLFTGILAAILGASLFVGPDQITTDFDAQIRVYGIWFTANFALCLWMAFNVDICGPVLKIVFCLMALAGLSRVYTMLAAGEFPTTTLVAAIVEIALIGFIPWHRHVLRQVQAR